MVLYLPQEDSELLKRVVEEEAVGEVLDMGTGSGIQGFAAAKRTEVSSVLAVDIDDESLLYTKEALKELDVVVAKKVVVMKSDLFSALGDMTFDTIICNPPYLPDEVKDDNQALYGGSHGWEFIARFLIEAKGHLKSDGKILLLFSSLTNKERVLREIKEKGYYSKELLLEAHFFERLYVYRLWKDGRGNDTFLAKGKRGEVFLRKSDNKTLLVKRRNPKSVVDTIANEAMYNALLNKQGIGPKFISYDAGSGELVREYIDGLEFRKWLPRAGRKEILAVLISVMQQCKVMDDLGVVKEEMTRPWKHIIITPEQKAVLIDFERCKESSLPKNVTQYCQFLTSTKMSLVLRDKDIVINKEEMIELAKRYKKNIKECLKEKNKALLQMMVKLIKNGN